jgi:hypothetical protein
MDDNTPTTGQPNMPDPAGQPAAGQGWPQAPVPPQQPTYGQPSPQAPTGQAQAAPANSQRPPLRIDHALLQELGLAGLPETEKKELEKHIYETLEMRVGMRLADQMTNEQLDEFETYFNARDDAGAFRWLETNFPNYKDIVAEEFDKLKAEVAQNAPHILAASQQAAAGAPGPEQPDPGSQPPHQAS